MLNAISSIWCFGAWKIAIFHICMHTVGRVNDNGFIRNSIIECSKCMRILNIPHWTFYQSLSNYGVQWHITANQCIWMWNARAHTSNRTHFIVQRSQALFIRRGTDWKMDCTICVHTFTIWYWRWAWHRCYCSMLLLFLFLSVQFRILIKNVTGVPNIAFVWQTFYVWFCRLSCEKLRFKAERNSHIWKLWTVHQSFIAIKSKIFNQLEFSNTS